MEEYEKETYDYLMKWCVGDWKLYNHLRKEHDKSLTKQYIKLEEQNIDGCNAFRNALYKIVKLKPGAKKITDWFDKMVNVVRFGNIINL